MTGIRTATRLQLNLAARTLAAGGIVAYPTEAVWGLGCEPLNRHACARLLALKRRPRQKGLIVIAATVEQVRPLAAALSNKEWKAALDSWPGPATWLIPAAPSVPSWLTGGRGTLAVRVTAHPVASALCMAYAGPIVSTSANVAGRPPARSALQARRRFGDEVDLYLPGPTGDLERPTPIRDLQTGKLLRP